jgi:hypothetical protein
MVATKSTSFWFGLSFYRKRKYEESVTSVPCAIRTLSDFLRPTDTDEPPELVLLVPLPEAVNGFVEPLPPVALTTSSWKFPWSECWEIDS